MSDWLVMAAAGAGTYGIRLSLLIVAQRRLLPTAVRQALRFIAPAVLTAFICQIVLYTGDPRAFDAGPGNERLLAALVAAVIAWTTRNVWLTIAAGMAALWLLQWWT